MKVSLYDPDFQKPIAHGMHVFLTMESDLMRQGILLAHGVAAPIRLLTAIDGDERQ